jgi:hypothetical protein
MKPDDQPRGDYLLRRHGDLPVASQFDAAFQSAGRPEQPAEADPSSQIHSEPRLLTLTQLPLCPHCQDNLFVRVERVLSGRRVSSAYYCGRCNDEWQVETPAAEVIERRIMERRRRPRPTRT